MPWRIFLVFEEDLASTAIAAAATSQGVGLVLPPLAGVPTEPSIPSEGDLEHVEALLRRLTVGPLETLPDFRIAINDIVQFVNELAAVGTIRQQVAGQALSPGQVVFLNQEAKWVTADSSSSATAPTSGYGVVSSVSAEGTPADVVGYGEAAVFSNLVAGKLYYLGTNGSLTQEPTQPIIVVIGRALTDKVLLVQPQYIGDTI